MLRLLKYIVTQAANHFTKQIPITHETAMTGLYLQKDVNNLLAGRTVVVIGSSVMRSVYKDIVCMLQEDRFVLEGGYIGQSEERELQNFSRDHLV